VLPPGRGDVQNERGDASGAPGQEVGREVADPSLQDAQTIRARAVLHGAGRVSATGAGSGERAAIYTAIFGGHDDLKPQPACPGVDFVCFTDDEELESSQWRVVPSEPRYEQPRLSAKWFRMHPHVVLPEYRFTIWIDGSFTVKRDGFADRVLGCLGESGFALPRHPVRDNLLDEAEVSLAMEKYHGQPIREQVEHYRAEGLDPHVGLWMTGLLVRDNANERTRRADEMWMEENLRWTLQDQISLPYVFWKLGVEPDEIPLTGNPGNNDLFVVGRHRSEL
jgi:hypothetical protein